MLLTASTPQPFVCARCVRAQLQLQWQRLQRRCPATRATFTSTPTAPDRNRFGSRRRKAREKAEPVTRRPYGSPDSIRWAPYALDGDEDAIKEATLNPKGPGIASPNPGSSPHATSNIHFYTSENPPPSRKQLGFADEFFRPRSQKQAPRLLFSADHFRTIPASQDVPEITFLGRSNVGKSSLLNALFGAPLTQPLARTSKKPGSTTTMNAFGVGGVRVAKRSAAVPATTTTTSTSSTVSTTTSNSSSGAGSASSKAHPTIIPNGSTPGLVVLDMPGYGENSRRQQGAEILKYLSKRPHLRRAFLLIDAWTGIKPTDLQTLALLRHVGVKHSIVLSKGDKLFQCETGRLVQPLKGLQGWQTRLRGSVVRDRLGEVRERVLEVAEALAPAPGEDGMAVSGGFGEVPSLPAEEQGAVKEVILTSAMTKNFEEKFLGIDALRWAVLRAVGLVCDKKGVWKVKRGGGDDGSSVEQKKEEEEEKAGKMVLGKEVQRENIGTQLVKAVKGARAKLKAPMVKTEERAKLKALPVKTGERAKLKTLTVKTLIVKTEERTKKPGGIGKVRRRKMERYGI